MKLYDGGISIILMILIIWAFLHMMDDGVDRHERRYHKQSEQVK